MSQEIILSKFESLNDLFQCFICMEKIQNAQLCPHCSKLCCFYCILRCLRDNRNCPNCRERLDMTNLVKCRWFDEIMCGVKSLEQSLGMIREPEATTVFDPQSISMNEELRWVRVDLEDEGVPDDAVLSGVDIDGSLMYVGRAFHNGNLIPAKVVPDRNIAYVPYYAKEHTKSSAEVLCCSRRLQWVSASNGHVPSNAVLAGRQRDGQPLYVGRVDIGGSTGATGEVHPPYGCIFLPFHWKEHQIATSFEVLTDADEL